ncbi:MAG TPA: alpha/beta hydrolase [Nocardioidaceae bacterium]|nr:alpha/beta hydrolase [Nocardioidaceae bacterium]
MLDHYLRRRLLGAVLTANALRPVPGAWTGIPAMFAGWLTAELAPHLLALTVADTAGELVRHRETPQRRRAGLALATGTAVGLGTIIKQSQDARERIEDALCDTLGKDYTEALDPKPTDTDLGTPWRQLLWPFRMRTDEVERTHDISYGPAGPRNLLDVYRHCDHPRGAPVLLQIHGGAWPLGDKDTQGIPLMQHMAARGFVCVAMNYRLSPRSKFPDHLVDVKRALAWVREHADEIGADPSFVAVTGGSAGGHLAAMMALTQNDPEYQPGFEDADTSVQAAVPIYGVYDFAAHSGTRAAVQRRDRFLNRYVMQADASTAAEEYAKATPLLRIEPDAPPFLVVHGTHDTLVPVVEAREFIQRLREISKQPVAYAELPGTQHAFDVFPSIRSSHMVRGVERFLKWCLAEHRAGRL